MIKQKKPTNAHSNKLSLIASELRYRRLFEAAQDGILILDYETGKIVDVNPFLIHVLKFPKNKFIGKQLWTLGFFKDIAKNKSNFLKLKRKKYLRYENLPLETADGRKINAEFVSNVYDVGGQKVIQCNIRDVTVRKTAEIALAKSVRMSSVDEMQASELRYRRLFETERDGNLILDYDTGKVIDVNPFLIELLGFKKEGFVGKQLWELGAFKDIAQNKANFLALKRKRFVRYDNLPMETADGRKISVEFYSNVFGVGDKKVIQCNIRDITQSKLEAEEASRMVTVVRDSNDAIIIQDFDGKILAWNHGAENIFGYSEKEALKMKIWQLAPSHKAAEQRDFNRRIFAGEKITSFETQRLTKDGRTLDVWLTVTKLVDNAGKVIGIASTERDMTERKQLEALKQLDALKDQFLNTTSHELKSPLIPIKSQCQLLLDGDYGRLNKEKKEAVEMIFRNEDRLERLISDVLDIAKAKSKKLQLILEKTDIGTIVTDSLESVQKIAKEKAIALSLKSAPTLPPIIADSRRITQVMANLLGNALKYTPKNGTIDVRLSKTKEGIRVSVHDTGIGMDQATLEKLFTPFFQADSRLDRKYGGTGLGLSICKGIVEAHGGKIWVESEGKNKGIIVTFTLPIKLAKKARK